MKQRHSANDWIGEQLSPPWLDAYWKSRFPGQIDPALAIAEALGGGVIQLEGEELVSIPTGHTDTRNTTCLHVPSIGLVVAGDVTYNDVHSTLAKGPVEVLVIDHVAKLSEN